MTTASLADPLWLSPDPRPLDWNGPVDRPFRAVSPEDSERPLLDLVWRSVEAGPDRVAVADYEGELSYRDLWTRARALGGVIGAQTEAGDLVGLLLAPDRNFAVAVLACMAAGRAFTPLDPAFPAAWLTQVLEDARPSLLIARGQKLASMLPQDAGVRILDIDRSAAADAGPAQPSPLGPDAPFCVVFTSGTTGRPKGIVNAQRALLQRAAQAIDSGHINAEDRLLTLGSPASIVLLRDLLTALVSGAAMHLTGGPEIGPAETAERARAQQVSVLFGFPAAVRAVVAAATVPAWPELRLVRIGGDVTLWSDIEQLRSWLAPGALVQGVYAATEAPMMQWFVTEAERGEDLRIPVGYPLAGNDLAILGDGGSPVAEGDAGELMVSSPYVALGTWRDGRFHPAPPGPRRFATGDVVRRRPGGLIERLGRKDRQVKVRGVRVELDGVEAALRRHPDVRDVAVLARPAGEDGVLTLIAYVSARSGAAPGLAEELEAMMRQSPAPMRPARIHLVREVPRLPSSKLDLKALAAMDTARSGQEHGPSAARPPSDPLVRGIAHAWEQVLGSPPASEDVDFFEAGGDSLKAVTLVLELERALGLDLPLTLIAEAPRFARLCELVRAGRAGPAPVVTLKTGRDGPALYMIHGAGGGVMELIGLARRLAWDGPVIGIQARGLGRGESPRLSVRSMAGAYLELIRKDQPKGPYRLCGYSSGGLVALEMASRLRAAGEEVAFLGLLDTPASVIWRRGRPVDPGLLRLLTRGPLSVFKVAAANVLATALYRPGFYPGEIVLVSPVEGRGAEPPERPWRARAASVRLVDVGGGHVSMLTAPHVEATAEALSRAMASGPDDGRRAAL